MHKLNKKKLLLGIAVIFVIFAVVFYIFMHFVYLPGVHIWWRFCSVNIEKNCYWYDEEAQEFTGEYSPIRIKVTGFDWLDWLPFINKGSELKGEIEIADYPIWSEGHDATLIFFHDFDFLKYKALIYVVERYAVIDDANVAHPKFGEVYYLWFSYYPEASDHIMVQVVEEREASEGPVMGGDKMGYVADSLEEARTMRELEMGE